MCKPRSDMIGPVSWKAHWGWTPYGGQGGGCCDTCGWDKGGSGENGGKVDKFRICFGDSIDRALNGLYGINEQRKCF